MVPKHETEDLYKIHTTIPYRHYPTGAVMKSTTSRMRGIVQLATLNACLLASWLGLATAWIISSVPRPVAYSTSTLAVHAIREGAFLTRNITDGESWLSSMRRDIKSMEKLTTTTMTPNTNKEESLRRAIQHTNAILDLYNETGRGLTEDLVMSTLENVVEHSTDQPSQVTPELLQDVERLVWRLRDFDLVPSSRVLHSLWEMQKYHCNHPNQHAEKASKQVGRQVNLLHHWRDWSEESAQQECSRVLPPPPESYFVHVLQYAVDEAVTMSFTLWELYQAISVDPKTACDRQLYSLVLQILAQSPSTWNVRQKRVLNDMISQSRVKLHEPLWPTPEEIRQALEATVPVGRAQDAAWLLRALDTCPQCSTDLVEECRTLFLRTLSETDEPGSLLYMEELLGSGKWENDSMVHWKLLLQKIARSEEPGCSNRARAVLKRIEAKYHDHQGSHWMPDAETLYYIVQAYSNDPQKSLSHALEVTELVKRCALTYDLYSSASQRPVRLFDSLLALFDDCARTDPRAVKAADDLFRFFVVQHRDGNVSGEEPDRFHLAKILKYYNRQFKKQQLQKGAAKSLEYFRLFQTLFQKNAISSPPDLFNVRQLLGTLARSVDPGFGSLANETLTEALAIESPIHPYALGHMYWCVIKCYCNENKIDQALDVLEQWEQAFAANPSLIRLTGAPYQTMINALTTASDKKAETTVLIVQRLEKQYRNGNRHVVLRSKLYKEALECCQYDPQARTLVDESFRRMNFTTLEEP